MEFFHLTLKNLSNKYRRLSIFFYAELELSNFPNENREFNKLFMETKYNENLNIIMGKKNFWSVMDTQGNCNNRSYKYLFFMGSTNKIISYDTSRESFIGMYNSLNNPISLEKNLLSNKEGKNLDSISCIHNRIEIKPYKEEIVCFFMGIGDTYEQVENIVSNCKSINYINEEFTNFKTYVREFIDEEKINTPDKGINIMVNIWCKYQTIMCRFFSKASYYQFNKGIGYRDHLQDSLIFLTNKNEYIKNQILNQALMQFKQGNVVHYFLDESGYFINSNSSDDNLWLVYITLIYIKENNDLNILNYKLRYIDCETLESLYDHLKRSLEYSFKNISENGLSYTLNHDWNDAISNFHGESIFVSEFLYLILNEFIEVCIIKEDKCFYEKIKMYMSVLKENVNKRGFNKYWYLRCINNTNIIGSYTCDFGKIYLLPQVFAVISNIATKERKNNIMNQVYLNLNTKYGLKILTPPYKSPNENIGYITRYPEGVRENGSIYYHCCMWGILAFILVNKNNIAKEIIDSILPPYKSKEIDKYKIEPYVMPSSVEGDYSKDFGRGNWSFNTGSSVWFHRIITNYVIGVRGTLKGLLIDPKPFNNWNEFSIIRKFKGATFNIYFKNNKGNKNKIYIFVNGEKIQGNVIKEIENNKTYEVNVVIN